MGLVLFYFFFVRDCTLYFVLVLPPSDYGVEVEVLLETRTLCPPYNIYHHLNIWFYFIPFTSSSKDTCIDPNSGSGSCSWR